MSKECMSLLGWISLLIVMLLFVLMLIGMFVI